MSHNYWIYALFRIYAFYPPFLAYIVRPPHIRGFWGGLLSASFAVLGRLNDGKTRLASVEGRPSAKTFIERLDAVLLDAGPLSPG
jgi:hypothetical protein